MRRTLTLTLVLAAATCALPALAGAELINGTSPAGTYTWTQGSNSLFGLFAKLVQLIIAIATVAAAGFFMFAGWLYLTSAGDSAKVERAHKIFKDVTLGFALLIGAWLIVVSILESLEAKDWVLNFFGR